MFVHFLMYLCWVFKDLDILLEHIYKKVLVLKTGRKCKVSVFHNDKNEH